MRTTAKTSVFDSVDLAAIEDDSTEGLEGHEGHITIAMIIDSEGNDILVARWYSREKLKTRHDRYEELCSEFDQAESVIWVYESSVTVFSNEVIFQDTHSKTETGNADLVCELLKHHFSNNKNVKGICY